MNDNYSIDVTHTIFICFTEKKNNSGMKRCRSRRRAIQIEREAEPILVKSALSGFLLKDPKSESAYFPVEHVDKNALLSRYGMQNVRIDFFTESVTDKDLGLIKYVLRLYNYSEKALKDKEITIRSVLGALGVERHRVVVVKNQNHLGLFSDSTEPVDQESQIELGGWSLKGYEVTVKGLPKNN